LTLRTEIEAYFASLKRSLIKVFVCVLLKGRSGLAITLVTPFDISLFQAVETHIGNL